MSADQLALVLNQQLLLLLLLPRYQHRLQWSKRKAESSKPDDFNELFLAEFVKTNVTRPAEQAYCRVEEEQDLAIVGADSLLKTPNNPFDFVIKKMPGALLDERFVLMYEEVLDSARRCQFCRLTAQLA